MKKIAATILLGLLLHVVFSSVGSDYNLAVIYWIFYTLGCGIIINYENQNQHLKLFLLSIPSPLIVILATYYRALFRGVDAMCWLSGTECAMDGGFFLKSLYFLMASIFFIWLFSYLSEWSIGLVIRLFEMSDERAVKIRENIVWVGALLVAIVGVAQILAHGWRP